MSKDAIMLCVDVGFLIEEPYEDGRSRLAVALECVKLTLQQKMCNNSTHELGFSIFGDNNCEDGNNLLLEPLGRPTIELVRKVMQLNQIKLGNTSPGGDIFHHINFALSLLVNHCGTKSYNKRIFIFTAGGGRTAFSDRNLSTLADRIRESGVKVNFIPIGFMEDYDIEENNLSSEPSSPEQQKNAQLIMGLKNIEPECIQVFPASIAIELYRRFRKKDVNPIALFRGPFQVFPGMPIDVATYKAVRKQKLNSLGKYDASQPFQAKAGADKQVFLETEFVITNDDGTTTLVDKDRIINAYEYGPDIVPLNEILEKAAKLFEQRNFKLLGFVEKERVPRHSMMSEVNIVVPGDSAVSRKIFSALITTMIHQDKYALARHVSRNNKNGVVPKLMVLIPYRTVDREMMYMAQLPTTEDVREYPFASLKQSTPAQDAIVDQLVQEMDLCPLVDGEEQEQLRSESTFNPVRQRFFQTLFDRALATDGTDTPIRPLDPVIRNYLQPQTNIYQRTEATIQEVKNKFSFERKQLPKQTSKANAIRWKDVLAHGASVTLDPTIQSETAELVGLTAQSQPQKPFRFDDDTEDRSVDPARPIQSFNNMLSNSREDLVNQALSEMSTYITCKRRVSSSPQQLRHLIDCCAAMRTGCDRQREWTYWDHWLDACRSEFGDALIVELCKQGFGYFETAKNINSEAQPKKPDNDEDDLD